MVSFPPPSNMLKFSGLSIVIDAYCVSVVDIALMELLWRSRRPLRGINVMPSVDFTKLRIRKQ